MFTKIYFRIPPFLMGVALAIFHFEYRFVDKLNDGTHPFHKNYLQRITRNSLLFKTVCYSAGLMCTLVPLLLLVWNGSCMQSEGLQQAMYLLKGQVQYCWGAI